VKWGMATVVSSNFKSTSRRLVGELLVVAVLTYGSRLPDGKSYSDGWEYVVGHPLLLLHVIAGAVTLVESIVLAVRSLRRGQLLFSVLAVVGFLSILGAFSAGDRLVAGQDAALDRMSSAWAVAMISYSVGWHVGRRRQRAALKTADNPDTASPSPATSG